MTTLALKVLAPDDGLRLQSGPGRDLVFKVTGEDTGGAFDYFTVEVAPLGGPPLHLHRSQNQRRYWCHRLHPPTHPHQRQSYTSLQ